MVGWWKEGPDMGRLETTLKSTDQGLQKSSVGASPGGSPVNTPCFHYRGAGLIPGQGTKTPCAKNK